MKRWLFNIAVGGSLLVAILVLILWIRTQFGPECVQYNSTSSPTHSLTLFAVNEPEGITVGYVVTSWPRGDKDAVQQFLARIKNTSPPSPGWEHGPVTTTQPSPIKRNSSGQSWFTMSLDGKTWAGTFNVKPWRLQVAHWFIVLVSGVLPMIWLIKFRRRRRLKLPGCCAKCGYDLRATPDRCPECGTVPQARPV